MAVPNEVITWSLGGNGTTDKGGTPVQMDWDTCTMVDHGGWDQFSGSFPVTPSTQAARPNPFPSNWAPGIEVTQGIDPVGGMHLPRYARQGQVVLGTRKNGQILWKGVIAKTPRVIEGRATVVAQGWNVLVERANERITYRMADSTQWSLENEDPFDTPGVNPDRFTLKAKKDGLGFIFNHGETAQAGDKDGYGLYLGAQTIVRCRFVFRNFSSDANFEIRVLGAVDFGAQTLISTIPCNTGDGTVEDIDVSGSGSFNTLYIEVRCNTGGTPAAYRRWLLRGLRVSCVTSSNTFTTSQVMSDLAGRLGYTDKTSGGATDLIGGAGLDWTGQWSDLMDYCALVEDYCWLVMDDPQNRNPAAIFFRPYGNKRFTTSMSQIANDSLEIQPLYNRSTTYYQRPRNVPHHLTNRPSDFNITDPLVGSAYVFPYPEPTTIDHPIRTTALPLSMNQNILARMTKYRVQGSCDVLSLNGASVPYDMKAGDLLTIGDFVPPVGAQRIAQINYNADGTATVTLDRYFDLDDTLRRARHHVRRHRR